MYELMNQDTDKIKVLKVKVILIGDTRVGKTNLINLANRMNFIPDELPTIGSSYTKLKMEINGINISVNLWDTPGQERFRSIAKRSFRDSKIVIFVYDITDAKSFEGIESWHQDIWENIGDDIIKGVVGNKNDLYENVVVNEEEAKKYAKSINAKFLCTSAKK